MVTNFTGGAEKNLRTYNYIVKRRISDSQIVEWKTAGRSWQSMAEAPAHLLSAIEQGKAPENVRPMKDGVHEIGELPVLTTISRQARWNRKQKERPRPRKRAKRTKKKAK
jgi:hypothetical protein